MKKTSSLLRKISFRTFSKDENPQTENGDQPDESNHSATEMTETKAVDEYKKTVGDSLPPTSGGEIVRRRHSKRQTIRTTCSLCSHDFHHPKVLPCEHVFCAKCLKPYVNPKSLLSCPTCHEEFPLKEGDPFNLPDHGSVMVALKAKKIIQRKTSSANTCFTCNVTGDENNCCLHCQKVYCKLCLVGHISVLKTQLDGMREQLEEAKTKIADTTFFKNKFDKLLDKISKLEKEQIRQIQQSKATGIQEVEKRRTEDEKLRNELEIEMDKILEESSEGMDAMDDEDVIKHFTEIQAQYVKSMQQMEKLSCEDLEVCENFQIREIRKVRQKKSFTLPTPTTNATNGASLNMVEDVEPEVNFSGYKRYKIVDSQRPTCAAVCPNNGLLYVCLPERKTVQVLSADGKLQSTIEEEFLFPIKVDFSPKFGEIYVLDKWKHNITVLTDGLDNQVSSILSKSGHAVGHLQSPCGLAVDVETGNIIIADTGNDRVQVLTRTGHFVRLIGGRCQKEKSGRIIGVESELSQPEDVAISSDGKSIVVADTGNNRVRVYSTSGEPLLVIGMKGHGNGQFNLPTSVAIHRNKFVLVAESGNQRVQVFNLESGKFMLSYSSFRGVTSIRENLTENLIFSESKTNSIFMLK